MVQTSVASWCKMGCKMGCKIVITQPLNLSFKPCDTALELLDFAVRGVVGGDEGNNALLHICKRLACAAVILAVVDAQ